MSRVTDILLLKQPEQPVLAIKKTIAITDFPMFLVDSINKIDLYLRETDELMTDVPYAIFHSFEAMDEKNTTIEIRFSVPTLLDGKGAIQSYMIPECKIVTCIYQGSNNDMLSTYDEMMKWITDKGYKATGDAYEYYYSGPQFAEEKMLTKIALPLR